MTAYLGRVYWIGGREGDDENDSRGERRDGEGRKWTVGMRKEEGEGVTKERGGGRESEGEGRGKRRCD